MSKQLQSIFKILQQIKCVLSKENDSPQIETLNPISYCEEGNITGYVAYTLDEETNEIVEIYFDSTGVTTIVKPEGIPCEEKEDYEFKFFEKTKCLEDGTNVLEVLCIPFIDGEEQVSSTFWVLNGVKVSVEPLNLVECEDCTEIGTQGTILDWSVLKINN